jgi:hypothetical protein
MHGETTVRVIRETHVIRTLVWRLLVAALLMCSGATRAQTDAVTAEALMRSSGMWQQLASVAPQVRAGLLAAVSRSGAQPGPAEMDRLARVIEAAYAADRLRATAMATFKADTQAVHVPALQQWYASRVGGEITRLEEAASAEQTDPQAVVEVGAKLLAAMPPDRRELLSELVSVTRSAETLVQLTIDAALAAQRGASSITPDAPGPSANELRLGLEAQRPQLLQAFTGLSLASCAAAYAALPSSELARYTEFLKSDAGRHFTDVGVKAFSAALVAASIDFGRGLPGTKEKANA